MVKAVFFDIDGTLVSFRTHSIPASAQLALDMLRQQGIRVFIASGRHLSAINNLGSNRFDGYVTINGGQTIIDGRVVDVHAMMPPTSADLPDGSRPRAACRASSSTPTAW